MIFVATLAALIGWLGQGFFGSFVDIPIEIVYTFQIINGINLGLVFIAVRWMGHESARRLNRKVRFVVREQGRHSFILGFTGIVTFAIIAFYELFPFGVVAALAIFPLLWMIWIIILTLATE